jgi:nucleoside 2-deoxyribosyltransferase
LRNPEAVIEVGNKLRAINVEGFDDWISPGPEADDWWKKYSQARGQNYAEALGSWAAKHVYEFDRHHLDRCDGAILVCPAGKSCHLEAGYMVGKGKPVWILLDEPERWDVMYQFAHSISCDIDEIILEVAAYA